MNAPLPPNESARLRALDEYNIMDTKAEEAFDNLVRCVSEWLEIPVAMVSLVSEDRQWFKAKVGVDLDGSDRKIAFCNHVVSLEKTLVVPDTSKDVRFAQHPFVVGDFGVKSYIGAPLRNHEGHVLGTLCAIDNRTTRVFSDKEIKLLESLADCVVAHLESRKARIFAQEQFAKAERATALKSKFLANMSHELRTPLNAIIGYAELALEELEDFNAQTHNDYANLFKDLKAIHLSSTHLHGLICDILDFSKLEADKMTVSLEEVRIGRFMEELRLSLEPLFKASQNTLIIHPKPISVLADRLRLRQVMINLINNANKFTTKGTITVETHVIDDASVAISVTDTGVGIQENLVHTMFESYAQEDDPKTKDKQGTGLGLSISKQLCVLMGGGIEAQSRKGEGATFTITLQPFVDQNLTPLLAPDHPGQNGPPQVHGANESDGLDV